jgi:hypothetical protein
MQAKIKQSSRYGTASLFSGVEFVKHEWRTVPAQYEDQARKNDLLEIREGKAEKEVIAKQTIEKAKPVMKARLVADYKDPTLRTFGDHEYNKAEWLEVPDGYHASARAHELLEIWEPGLPEPAETKAKKSTRKFSGRKSSADDAESEE